MSIHSPFLSDEELNFITAPITRGFEQCRVLRDMGFIVKLRPNGKPLVARSNFELVMSGRPAAANDPLIEKEKPNEAAFLAVIAARQRVGSRNGKETEKQSTGATG